MYLTRYAERVLCAQNVPHNSHLACCAPVGEEEALYTRDAEMGAAAAFHASARHSIALQPGEQLRAALAPHGSCPADALRFEVGCSRLGYVRVSETCGHAGHNIVGSVHLGCVILVDGSIFHTKL